MTQAALTTELLAMRERAERTAQNIDQISRNLSAERQSLQQVVNEYGKKRVELFKQELHARGITWCTYCYEVIPWRAHRSEAIPESETELLLVEGREEYSHGYGNAYYGFRDFLKLHRACPTCREYAANRHGQKGKYNLQAKDQSCFYAFRVERREDGYYARKFGIWVKLDDKNCSLDEPRSELVEKLAEELNLPPRIEIESKWPNSEEKLIIHEQVAIAEAS